MRQNKRWIAALPNWMLIAVTIAASTFGLFLWWLFSWLEVQTTADRIDVVGIGLQTVTAFFFLSGALATIHNVRNSNDTLRLSQSSQYAERFYRAVEHLGSENVDIRVGAIHALSSLAQDSDSHYRQSMDVLVHFVRRKTNLPTYVEDQHTDTSDVQAAISILCRRRGLGPDSAREPLDFRSLALDRIDFGQGWLENSDFRGSRLRGACFTGALLSDALFQTTDCSGCRFQNAELQGANFTGADLMRTQFSTETDPSSLQGGLSTAIAPRLQAGHDPLWWDEAEVRSERGIRLNGTVFTDADLMHTNFLGVDLSLTKGLVREQLEYVRTDDSTVLPRELPSSKGWKSRHVA
ncbi:MAG: pentapeptide repeat-containing protein [Chloroflexota bacterium]|nr:pentapeptide repeat-containing protein [Chloroflexota bacterium]